MKLIIATSWDRATRKTVYLIYKGPLFIAKRSTRREADKVLSSLERDFDPWKANGGTRAWLLA